MLKEILSGHREATGRQWTIPQVLTRRKKIAKGSFVFCEKCSCSSQNKSQPFLSISQDTARKVQAEENTGYFEKVSCLSLGLYLKGQ